MGNSSRFKVQGSKFGVQSSRFRILGLTIQNSLHSVLVLTAVLLCACSGKGDQSSTKFKQYYNQGELLYQNNCSNCHQKNGTGLGRVYPPLKDSDYMKNNFSDVVCLIRNGKTGEVIVNGISFNQPMPGVTSLTDLEIAEIATYIYNSWGHQLGIVEVKEVSRIMKACPPTE
mgnify:CR=1 FL=1